MDEQRNNYTAPKTVIQFAISGGGVKQHVVDLSSGIDRKYFRCIGVFPDKLMCSTVLQNDDSKYQNAFKEIGLNFYTLEVPRHIDLFRVIGAVFGLIRIIKKQKNPVALHCHSTMAGFIGRLAKIFVSDCRLVYTHHSPYFLLLEDKKTSLIFRLIEKVLFPLTDFTVAVSESEYEDLQRELGPSHRIVLIRNGVNVDAVASWKVDRAELLQSLGVPLNSKVLLSPARLEYPKDVQTTIKAIMLLAKKHPELAVLLAGNGPEKCAIQDIVRKAGIDNLVFFLGWRDDIKDLMAASDFVVLSSYGEGLPYALIEASAMRKPVLGSICRGIVDVIVHEKTGFLFPIGDEKALATYLGRLLNDTVLCRNMGQNGYEHVLRYFNLKDMIRNTVKLYSDV